VYTYDLNNALIDVNHHIIHMKTIISFTSTITMELKKGSVIHLIQRTTADKTSQSTYLGDEIFSNNRWFLVIITWVKLAEWIDLYGNIYNEIKKCFGSGDLKAIIVLEAMAWMAYIHRNTYSLVLNHKQIQYNLARVRWENQYQLTHWVYLAYNDWKFFITKSLDESLKDVAKVSIVSDKVNRTIFDTTYPDIKYL